MWRGRGGEESDGDSEASGMAGPGVALGQGLGALSPVRGSQGAGAPGDGPEGNVLREAVASLKLGAAPGKLPCRDEERGRIRAFVEQFLSEASGPRGKAALSSCLYLSGTPGTGKTATVRDVMAELTGLASDGELPSFTFLEINAMKIPSPQHLYQRLLEEMGGERRNPVRAREELDGRIGAGRGLAGDRATLTVVLVDEMDMLATRSNRVLFDVFHWPTRPGSRVAVIGIANTADLLHRAVPQLAGAIPESRRMIFNPYSLEQLETIARSRVGRLGVFDEAAIKLACMRISNKAGDVRSLLSVLRRCCVRKERLLREHGHPVTPENLRPDPRDPKGVWKLPDGSVCPARGPITTRMVAHENKIFFAGNTKARFLFNTSRLERLLIAALLLVQRRTGVEDVSMEDVWETSLDLCEGAGEKGHGLAAMCSAAVRLAAQDIIMADGSEGGRRMKLKNPGGKVQISDLSTTLQEDASLGWLLDKLQQLDKRPA